MAAAGSPPSEPTFPLRRSLRWRLSVAMVSLAVAPLAAGATLVYFEARSLVRSRILQHMEAVADSRGAHVESVMTERLTDLEVLAGNVSLREAAEAALGRGAGDPARRTAARQRLGVLLGGFEASYRDSYGVVLLRLPDRAVLGRSPALAPAEVACLARVALPAGGPRENRAWIAEMHLAPRGRAAVAHLVARVPLPSGTVAHGTTAVVVAATDLSRTAYPRLDDPVGLGETGEVVLVDSTGLALKPLRHDPEAALRRRLHALPAARAAAGGRGVVEAADYAGHRVLAAHRHLPALNWGLVAKMDTSEAYADLRLLSATSAALVLVVAGLAMGVGEWVASRLALPIRDVSQAARRLATGEVSARAAAGGDDEVGQLARDFNAMAQQVALTQERLEGAVRQRTAELERSNADLAQFAYVASHDLQEPLRNVRNSVQLLASRYEGQLGPEADKLIRYASEGTRRMQRLIEDLLSYSRVGTGGGAFVPTDVREAVAEAMAALTASLEETGGRVECGELPTVMADPRQLAQLFLNLLSNALKYRSEAPPEVRVTAVRKGEEWVFAVRDNGIGIDPRNAERVFVMFQRLRRSEGLAGTGIGLAVCKRIVERHGGRIWVESEIGAGATFYLTLPAVDGDGNGR